MQIGKSDTTLTRDCVGSWPTTSSNKNKEYIMYEYKVKKIIKIYDGDTITVEIDLGFNTSRLEILRLANIDTPEVRGKERPDGLVARDYLRARLETAVKDEVDIIIKTEKDSTGKYGRYIASIFIDGVSINNELVLQGLAEVKIY